MKDKPLKNDSTASDKTIKPIEQKLDEIPLTPMQEILKRVESQRILSESTTLIVNAEFNNVDFSKSHEKIIPETLQKLEEPPLTPMQEILKRVEEKRTQSTSKTLIINSSFKNCTF